MKQRIIKDKLTFKDFREVVKGMRRIGSDSVTCNRDGVFINIGYNQALDDVLAKLKNWQRKD